jgi:serine/threonine protein kinase
MTISALELLDQLSRYGLINRLPQDGALLALDVDQASDSEIVVSRLVDRGHLTQFQARVIRAGQVPNLLVDQYVILDKLGEGGMGVVFKARHKLMDRLVAIKLLTPQLSKRPELARRFHREIRMQSKLSHPSIVTAFDAGEVRGCLYLAMEYVEGNNLTALVREHGPLLPPRALELIEQAAEGLAFAHRLGVIHRDIKPQNLIVDRSGRLKILDFGLARLHLPWEPDSDPPGLTETSPDVRPASSVTDQAVSELTMAGQIMGTVDYMAPEQVVDSRSVDTRCDIYSLGCTLHFLLTGKVVFPGKSAIEKVIAHREHPIPSLSPMLAGVPDDVRQQLELVFARMVAKDRTDRFASTDDLVQALSQLRALLNARLNAGTTSPSATGTAPSTSNATTPSAKQVAPRTGASTKSRAEPGVDPRQGPRDRGQRPQGGSGSNHQPGARGARPGDSSAPRPGSSAGSSPPGRHVSGASGPAPAVVARSRPEPDLSRTEILDALSDESDSADDLEVEVPSFWSRPKVRVSLGVGVVCLACVGWTVWSRRPPEGVLIIEPDRNLTTETDSPAPPGEEHAPPARGGNVKRKFKL